MGIPRSAPFQDSYFFRPWPADELTLEAIRQGGSSPIRFEDLMSVSEATIAIEEAIGSGEVVSLRAPQTPAVHQTAEKL